MSAVAPRPKYRRFPSPESDGRVSGSAVFTADTGPGLDGAPTHVGSTGVGLANIRDRLAQAYGDNHRFETQSVPAGPDTPGGFRVLIEIPYQIEAEEPK